MNEFIVDTVNKTDTIFMIREDICIITKENKI